MCLQFSAFRAVKCHVFMFCCVCQEVDVRFIEYMPFDGNKWNQWKMVPYAEMMSHIRSRYPDIIRLPNAASDTSKVCILLSLDFS